MDLERSVDRMLASGGAWLWIDGEPVSLAVRRVPAEGSAGSVRCTRPVRTAGTATDQR